ncbi:uncharacterized protein LOC124458226 [Xenia sp. Carnegie-2017]|uniref:uncharacterized protein LOC124458226 n=1 Tax=Xenia sp. Carnegie-2017 TaxID=2897299 RepID=UPI001F03CA80|nr:uncharacterized protein LOC124458226 [Xenia sp. Carnegie-2017]
MNLSKWTKRVKLSFGLCIIVLLLLGYKVFQSGEKFGDIRLECVYRGGAYLNNTSWGTGKFRPKQRLHLVTNYPIMYLKPWSQKQSVSNIDLFKERQEEIEETLQRNLDHPFVSTIHLFINQDTAEKRLNNITLRNKHKITIVPYTGMPSYKHFFTYINKRLQNKVLAITNMDVYLGEGFNNLNVSFLKSENIAYVLTRHGKKEKRCDLTKTHGYCEISYSGSHDTYILIFTKPISDEVLNIMDIDMNRGRIDNRLLWVFKNKLRKNLLNPCRYLKTYHNHCIKIHGQKRYNMIPKEGKYLRLLPTGFCTLSCDDDCNQNIDDDCNQNIDDDCNQNIDDDCNQYFVFVDLHQYPYCFYIT